MTYPVMKIPRDIGEKFIHGTENSDLWRVNIEDDGHTQTLINIDDYINYFSNLNYLNSTIFKLNNEKDKNIINLLYNKIIIQEPSIFYSGQEEKFMYITEKNDPTILIDSFEINTNDIYQVEYIDAAEYDAYVPNTERKNPDFSFFEDSTNENYFNSTFTQLNYYDIKDTQSTVTSDLRNILNYKNGIYVTMKNDPYILLDIINENINIIEDDRYNEDSDVSFFSKVPVTENNSRISLSLNMLTA